jgi:general secretion pathway protein D
VRPLLALAIVASLTLVSVSRPAAAPEPDGDGELMYPCGKPKGTFKLAFKPELELGELVTWAMGFSCKRILYATALATRSAKVTMLTPGELSAEEAWRVFQAALGTMGLAIVKKGAVLEVVESAVAKDEALAISSQFPDGGRDIVRLLYKPTHASVEDLKLALELVKSRHGVVAALPALRALLVTDDAAHVARMEPLVRELDVPPGGEGVYAIPIEHLDAETVVETLRKLIGDTAAPGSTAPFMTAVARVNAVFVVGSAAQYLRARSIASAIDVDLGDAAKIHSMPLRHARAKDVATTLSTLVGTGSGNGGAMPGPAGSRADVADSAALTGPVRFAADEASNTLLALAAPRDALALRSIVADLDAPRRQVYIEALVLEVEAASTREVGLGLHGGKPDSGGDYAVVGSFSAGLSSADPTSALAASGLVGGVLGAPLTGMLSELLGTTVPSFGALVRLAAHNSRLDVLASPHVMTLDNKLATISVGANIPYKSSSGATTAATPYPVQPNIERQKVALTLAITPHVAPALPGETGDTIQLDVRLDSQLLGQEDYGGLGPSWKERGIEASVRLRDQESIVLGGLVDERVEDTTDSIPVLGDIPVLGRLFRSNRKVRLKSNLLVILTPHLVDDSLAGRAILDRRMRERDELISGTAALRRRSFEPNIDYRTRRGLVADIDVAVRLVEEERAARAAAARELAIPSGRIDGDGVNSVNPPRVDGVDSVPPGS